MRSKRTRTFRIPITFINRRKFQTKGVTSNFELHIQYFVPHLQVKLSQLTRISCEEHPLERQLLKFENYVTYFTQSCSINSPPLERGGIHFPSSSCVILCYVVCDGMEWVRNFSIGEQFCDEFVGKLSMIMS